MHIQKEKTQLTTNIEIKKNVKVERDIVNIYISS